MAGEEEDRNEASSCRSGSGGLNKDQSVVVDWGRSRGPCGYCGSGEDGSISHGLWAQSLTVDDYQALLDRGWRRSGCLLYKSEMERTCCPPYAIRLKANDFVPSKEQIRVSKRIQRFLEGMLGTKMQDAFIDETSMVNGSCSCATNENKCSPTEQSMEGDHLEKNNTEGLINYLLKQIDNAVCAFAGSEYLHCDILLPKASIKLVSPAKRKLLVEGSEDLLFTSNICFQIAAALKWEQKDVHCSKKSRCSEELNGKPHEMPLETSPQMIAEKLAKFLKHLVESSGLSIRACNGHMNFYSPRPLDQVFERDKLSKKSIAQSRSGGICSNTSSGTPQGRRRRLEIRLERSSFDSEEFALYRKYQIKVHNDIPDHVTEDSYRTFLVDTPLVFVPSTGDATVPPCGFGSFHQQYLIDDQLVAVGVIDILPGCLSSKYLFWDPDLAFLSLGKYTALQEISWVKENLLHCPSLEYYYLGYYIHSCHKMRYKASYCPSELLCPIRYQWVPFDVAKPLLDRKPYVVLSDYATSPLGQSSTANFLESGMELEHNDDGREDMKDILIDEEEEMSELDSEDSDDGLDSESGSLTSVETEGNVANVLVDFKGSQLRYKDIQHAIDSTRRRFLENRLHRYTRAVGTELSKGMVYYLE